MKKHFYLVSLLFLINLLACGASFVLIWPA